MMELGLKTLIAYLLGSLMGALLAGLGRGVDIRKQGSGNPGGTNALRTQGVGFAAATVIIDVGKGWIAAGWLPSFGIPGVTVDPAVSRDWLAVCCAAAAVSGHIWPQFFGFRGGKGGATLLGTFLALAPVLVAVAIAAWFVVAMLTGFVGLATPAAAAAMPVAVRLLELEPPPLFAYAVAMALLVAWAHRGNFARIRAGKEPHLKRLWLLRPRGKLR